MKIDSNCNIYKGNSQIMKVYKGAQEIYSVLPYTPVEYIRSDHHQYIDTLVPCNTIGRIVTKFKVNTINTYNWMFGASGNDWAARQNTFGIGLSTAESNRGFCYNSVLDYPFANNTMYEIDYKVASGAQTAVVNGVTYTSNYASTINGSNCYIFALDYQNWSKENERSGADLYETIFYGLDQTTIIRDFVPAIEIETGIVCLYDKITKQFYYNLGSGDFIAGPNI